jgi:hypothetical protein
MNNARRIGTIQRPEDNVEVEENPPVCFRG